MRLALLQMQATAGNPDENIEMIANAAATAADRGADLLLAPELAITGYGAGDAMQGLAQPADGAWFARLHDTARKAGIGVVAGFPERAGSDIYNSALIVDPRKEAPAVYRKSHLYGAYEKNLFRPAQPGTVQFSCAGLTCAILICYDVEFPENARRLALAGADIVLVPTALPQSNHAGFIAEQLVAVRAFENQVFVAYANHAGADQLFTYAGRSNIVAPDGVSLASAPADAPALLFANIEPGSFQQSRQENSYLADFKPLV